MGPASDVRATSIGAGTRSADVIVHGPNKVAPITLMTRGVAISIRRNPGTLPSRVADNLYWLGRYLERGEAVLALVHGGSAGVLESDTGQNGVDSTLARICRRLFADAAITGSQIPEPQMALAAALDDRSAPGSVVALLEKAHEIGEGSRERISPDFWQLLDAPFPNAGLFPEKNQILKTRFAAFAGLAAENMGRTASWRFHDLGRRIERAIVIARWIAEFAHEDASASDLAALLDLCDVQISYRQRYATGMALYPVRDLVGLDPFNPRSLDFQIKAIAAHLDALPRLTDDGMAEPHQKAATAMVAMTATMTAKELTPDVCRDLEWQLKLLSEAIGNRFFLRGSETIRSSAMVLA